MNFDKHGVYTIELVDEDGTVHFSQDNLITAGYESIYDFHTTFTLKLGDGDTEVLASDINLAGSVVASADLTLTTTSLGLFGLTKTFRRSGSVSFSGLGGTTIREVGVFAKTAGTPMLSRAKFKDGAGRDRAIQPTGGMILNITYSLHFVPPESGILAQGTLPSIWGNVDYYIDFPALSATVPVEVRGFYTGELRAMYSGKVTLVFASGPDVETTPVYSYNESTKTLTMTINVPAVDTGDRQLAHVQSTTLYPSQIPTGPSIHFQNFLIENEASAAITMTFVWEG